MYLRPIFISCNAALQVLHRVDHRQRQMCIRNRIRRIQDGIRALQAIAGGDFTAGELGGRGEDETARLQMAINKMSRDVRAVIRQVKDAAAQVASSAEELSAGIEQLSRATGQINGDVQAVAAGGAEQGAAFSF